MHGSVRNQPQNWCILCQVINLACPGSGRCVTLRWVVPACLAQLHSCRVSCQTLNPKPRCSCSSNTHRVQGAAAEAAGAGQRPLTPEQMAAYAQQLGEKVPADWAPVQQLGTVSKGKATAMLAGHLAQHWLRVRQQVSTAAGCSWCRCSWFKLMWRPVGAHAAQQSIQLGGAAAVGLP